MEKILLLGAGFSRNWGGWLAEEMTNVVFARVRGNPDLERRFRKVEDGQYVDFESVLDDVQQEYVRDTVGNRPNLDAMQGALQSAFAEMDASYAGVNFNISNDVGSLMSEFLAGFDAIFTLNQDSLLEMHYRFLGSPNWDGVGFPGLRPPANWWQLNPMTVASMQWSLGSVVETDPGRRTQPIYKLHGSAQWRGADNTPVVVMGGSKSVAIRQQPLLAAYSNEFTRRLRNGDTRLCVIGYGFRDPHINQALLDACETGLTLLLVDTRGRRVWGPPPNAYVAPPNPLADIPCLGVSMRPLTSTFNGDRLEHAQLMRIFSD